MDQRPECIDSYRRFIHIAAIDAPAARKHGRGFGGAIRHFDCRVGILPACHRNDGNSSMEKKAKTAMLSKRRPKGQAAGTSQASVRVVHEAASLPIFAGARDRVANSAQTILYWYVGRRLLKENLQEGSGAYGKRILATVSQELRAEFGEGFSYSALTRMVRFAESPLSLFSLLYAE